VDGWVCGSQGIAYFGGDLVSYVCMWVASIQHSSRLSLNKSRQRDSSWDMFWQAPCCPGNIIAHLNFLLCCHHALSLLCACLHGRKVQLNPAYLDVEADKSTSLYQVGNEPIIDDCCRSCIVTIGNASLKGANYNLSMILERMNLYKPAKV